MIEGWTHLTNLTWNLDEAALCRALHLDRVMLLNDLAAVAYAVPHLEPGELTPINAVRAVPHSAIANLAPGWARRFWFGAGTTRSPAPRRADTPISRPPMPRRPGSGRS